MESDINYPKSKAFNIFLRFLQLALSLAATVFVAELVEKVCIDGEFRVVEILIGVLLLASLAALMTVKCSNEHPKLGFAVMLVIVLGAAVAIAVYSVKDIADGNRCALTSILFNYYLGTTALYTLIAIAILVLPLLWVQRFSNSPGNLVWPVFFLYYAFAWKRNYGWTFISIALLTLAISLLTLVTHLWVGCKGVTTCTRSFMSCSWITNLFLMVAAEVVAVLLYASCRQQD